MEIFFIIGSLSWSGYLKVSTVGVGRREPWERGCELSRLGSRLGTSVSFLLSDHDGLRYFVNKMAEEVSSAFVDPLIL